MEFNISEEKMNQLVEEEARKLIRKKIEPKVNGILKDRFWFSQNLANELNESLENILRHRVGQILPDEELKKLIHQKHVSTLVADRIVAVVSEDITNAVQEHFKW